MENKTKSDKKFITALLLCAILGVLGMHRFYTHKYGTAILMFILSLLIVGLIWWFVDLAMIVSQNFKDKQGNVIKESK